MLFFVLLTFSCNLNSLSDLDVDEKYKKHLSDAVLSIGIHKIKIILRLELVISLTLIIWLTVLMHNPLFLLAALGIIAGFAYSAPPLRIKKRGLISFIPVMGGLYFLPIVGGWFLMTAQVSWFILLFGLGYAFLMQGITFINTCEDYREDELSGIRTIAHILGVRRTLFFGTGLVLTGGLLDIGLILGGRVDWKSQGTAQAVLICVFSLLFVAVIISIARRLYRIGRSAESLELSKKSAARMPVWFLLTRYPLWMISLIAINPHGRWL
jgi:4-hydroxybenzoate polyprenyltransferase